MSAFPYQLKGIPCTYKGIKFRSLLEGRIAYFFDKMNFKWSYEPFEVNGYIPDFLLKIDSNNYYEETYIVDVKPFFDEQYKKKVYDKLMNCEYVQSIEAKARLCFFSEPFELNNVDKMCSLLGQDEQPEEWAKKQLKEMTRYTGFGDPNEKDYYELWNTPLIGLKSHLLFGEFNKESVCNGIFVWPETNEPNILYRGLMLNFWNDIRFLNEQGKIVELKKKLISMHDGTVRCYEFGALAKENHAVRMLWKEACNTFQYQSMKKANTAMALGSS